VPVLPGLLRNRARYRLAGAAKDWPRAAFRIAVAR